MRAFDRTRAWQNQNFSVVLTDTSTARLGKSLPEETVGLEKERKSVQTIRIYGCRVVTEKREKKKNKQANLQAAFIAIFQCLKQLLCEILSPPTP